jgi:DNA modification methylase
MARTAIYPIKLIERIIMLCSVEGQLVLDPLREATSRFGFNSI